MRIVTTIIYLSIIFFSISCKHRTEKQNLIAYLNNIDNNILQKESINGVELTVKYVPVVYQKIISEDSTKATADDYQHNILFNVKINKAEFKKDKATSLYLAFDIQNDFQLKINNEWLMPVICQKIENGIKDNYEYMVAFETPALENSKNREAELIYNDKIFGTGQRKFSFKKNDIIKIPRLISNR